jgi:hypothetical protein
MTSNITYPYKFTLKGGGGGGGAQAGGNGGQGGTTVGYFYVQSGVTYKLLVGAPGQKRRTKSRSQVVLHFQEEE